MVRIAQVVLLLLALGPASAAAGWAELCSALDTLLVRAGATNAAPANV